MASAYVPLKFMQKCVNMTDKNINNNIEQPTTFSETICTGLTAATKNQYQNACKFQ